MQILWNRLLLLSPLFRADWVNRAARQHPGAATRWQAVLTDMGWSICGISKAFSPALSQSVPPFQPEQTPANDR
jgi:hypothetical protein